MDPTDAPRSRAVIEGVDPEIDAGAFPAKTVVGDAFTVEADIFADGHDKLRAVLLYRTERQRKWREAEMEPLGNDRWQGTFTPEDVGRSVYSLVAWVDRWGTWVRDLRKRVKADQDVRADLRIGAGILDDFSDATKGSAADELDDLAYHLRDIAETLDEAVEDGKLIPAEDVDLYGLLDELESDRGAVARTNDPRRFATRYHRDLPVVVDRERAAFSAWYEFFPRSTGEAGEHGTFATAAEFLPYVAEMGFDVVYLPPIHPVGETKRKGANNAPEAEPGEHGSPWAIGGRAGGHTAVHPDLGTLEDFRTFRKRAEELGLEVALDVAFQVSPDHPWVEEHPEFFRHRPDGSIQYAENPPKKYEDIYPIDFETPEWKSLWKELRRVFEFWIDQGVEIFRVDNPHTKSLRFWRWCIDELKSKHPGVIFLSEAFTRPRVMYHLAKAGFTQSYTYFAWRDRPAELREYMRELTRTEVRHFFRPNFWPNTPDILTETLQHGGRGAFMMRHVLAATLTANYGIYGPAFELLEHLPREEGGEEYLHSEKYQLRDWDLERPDSLRDFITRINAIRREYRALQRNDSLRFHEVDNEMMLVYSKWAEGEDPLLVVVNMDPHHTQAGWTRLDLAELGLGPGTSYQVQDLISDAWYHWQGDRNDLELDPHVVPAHVFRVVRHNRTEKDYEPHA